MPEPLGSEDGVVSTVVGAGGVASGVAAGPEVAATHAGAEEAWVRGCTVSVVVSDSVVVGR